VDEQFQGELFDFGDSIWGWTIPGRTIQFGDPNIGTNYSRRSIQFGDPNIATNYCSLAGDLFYLGTPIYGWTIPGRTIRFLNPNWWTNYSRANYSIWGSQFGDPNLGIPIWGWTIPGIMISLLRDVIAGCYYWALLAKLNKILVIWMKLYWHPAMQVRYKIVLVLKLCWSCAEAVLKLPKGTEGGAVYSHFLQLVGNV
jgi:hypothetical protein